MTDVAPITRTAGALPCQIPGDVPHEAHDSCPGRATLLAGDWVMDAVTAAWLDWTHLARQLGPTGAAAYYPTPPPPPWAAAATAPA